MSVNDSHVDATTDVSRHTYRPGTDEPLSVAVVTTLATAADVDPAELPPIQQTVDADALDAFDERTVAADTSWSLRFVHAGYEVNVFEGELVVVTDVIDEE